MVAQKLEPIFSNHTRLKGLFFIIDVDDSSSAVTLEDLAKEGIGL
jgi:hypothetical protein